MAPQDKKWDDSAERDLCVSMVYCNNEGKGRTNWPRIEEVMNGLGYSFTKDAMSQHFSKTIMKEFKARHPSLPTSASSPPLSARKPRAAAGKAATSTPSKKRTKKSATKDAKDQLSDGGDDDVDYDSTPCKRVKKEEKSAAVKKEEAADATAETAVDDDEQAFRDWAAKGPSEEE
ncbi:hypothetical protein FP744_10003652 [Trichoderma asperellum]|nr:hypothetical protein LI328DRAFT_143338 [Trichoderma asperelloides]